MEKRTFPTLSVSEGIPTLLWTTDRDLLLTSIHGSFPFEGARAEDYLGAPLESLFPGLTTDSSLLQAHRRALRGESSTIHTEMSGCAVHAHVEPIRGADGVVIGIIGTAHDDTERHVAEKALRLFEESYRGLIERAPFAICQSTISGQLLQVNPTMVEMLGYESETELLLCSLRSDIMVDESSYAEFFQELQNNEVCRGFESQWRRPNGEPIDVSIAGRAFRDAAGRISHLEILAENITERKRLEAQLRQGQKIQAIGQLAAGIAHDFNNLLSIISGEAEILQAENRDHSVQRRLDTIERATDQASKLTKQLLAFTRLQMLQSKVVDPNAVIARMHQMLARLLGDMIEVTFLPDSRLGRIKVDPSQLEQVVMNLAVNARDAMPAGGRLSIGTRKTQIDDARARQLDLEHSGEYAALVVSDTGHGIDRALQSKIFDPFFTTKPAGHGTGLGLAVVYSVVKQCGGSIEVESESGLGTVFTLYFACVPDEAEQNAAPPALVQHTAAGHTILLAEDEEVNRRIYTEYLEGLGYQVIAAADDEAALDLANRYGEQIDLLVTDLMMPKTGGYLLAQTLQNAYPRLKVILISGQFEDFGANLPSGSQPFLQKPFRLKALAEKIRELLA